MDNHIDKPAKCGCCAGLFAPRDQDRRLATSYPAYIVGRWLALIGSCLLLLGLLIKFILLDRKGAVDILTLVIISISLVGIGVGALCIFWSARQARKAQLQYEDERRLRLAFDN